MKFVVSVYSEDINEVETNICENVTSYHDLLDRVTNLINYFSGKYQAKFELLSIVLIKE